LKGFGAAIQGFPAAADISLKRTFSSSPGRSMRFGPAVPPSCRGRFFWSSCPRVLSPADSPPHRYDKRMAAGETRLELARGRVREAEQRVEVQRELVRELTRNRLATHDAEELLLIFERTLQVLREHLAEEERTHDPPLNRPK